MSRRALSRGYNRANFRRTGDKVKAINIYPTLMRGGYRL